MFRQWGGRDEEFFAVPGYTVANEGIPRIPFLPSRDKQSVFWRADEALFTLPPAYFYWQAPFFWFLPAGHGTARLSSAIAGIVAVVLLYQLSRRLLDDETSALWAAGLYSISRTFFFPATNARPDMLCMTLGLAALLSTLEWQRNGRRRNIVISGLLLGLGLLTHPFAIVYCIQIGVWVFVAGQGKTGSRLIRSLILVGCAAAGLSLWTPLIMAYPDHFFVQFTNNVLKPSGPGLISRLIWPWDFVTYQAGVLLEQTQILQFGIMTLGLLVATLAGLLHRRPGVMGMVGLTWSSVYLLVACSGRHPSHGYWCYPTALMFVCVSYSVVALSRWCVARMPRFSWIQIIGGFCLVGAMMPGAGVKAWIAHVRHWSDSNYRSSSFAQQIAKDIPKGSKLIADPAIVFDLYLLGYPVLVGWNQQFFFDVRGMQFDYLVDGPVGRQYQLAQQMDVEDWKSYGDPNDEFSCYVQIYRPKADLVPAANLNEGSSSNQTEGAEGASK